jgi:hypothetical protein
LLWSLKKKTSADLRQNYLTRNSGLRNYTNEIVHDSATLGVREFAGEKRTKSPTYVTAALRIDTNQYSLHCHMQNTLNDSGTACAKYSGSISLGNCRSNTNTR